MTATTIPLLPPDVVIDLARSYAADAVGTLVHLMKHATSESVRLSAAKAILSRGYGNPSKAAAEKPSRLAGIPMPTAAVEEPVPPPEATVPLAAMSTEEIVRPQPRTAMELRRAWRTAAIPRRAPPPARRLPRG